MWLMQRQKQYLTAPARIERILTKDEEEKLEPDLLFPEDVLVKKEYTDIPGIPEKLRVINRYRYSENDTLVLEDYRIAVP